MDLKEFREIKGFSQSELAKTFEINKRTVENWEHRNCCPVYVLALMEEILRLDNEIFKLKQENTKLNMKLQKLQKDMEEV